MPSFDPRSPRALWEAFAPDVFRLLHRTLGPEQPVDDAAQDVFLRVFDAAPQGADCAALRPIILSAVARVVCERLRWRKLRRRPRGATSSSLVSLYRILGRLRARDQVAFAFHFIDGLDVREVAAALGESSARIDRRLVRAWDSVAARVSRDTYLTQVGHFLRADRAGGAFVEPPN